MSGRGRGVKSRCLAGPWRTEAVATFEFELMSARPSGLLCRRLRFGMVNAFTGAVFRSAALPRTLDYDQHGR
jgi:hypothetical protein